MPGRKITVNKRTYTLTSAEYQSYARFVQQNRWKRLEPMVTGKRFKALMRTNSLRAAELLDREWQRIGYAARNEWLRRHPEVKRAIAAAPMRRYEPSYYMETLQ
jgi:hypothetical protein